MPIMGQLVNIPKRQMFEMNFTEFGHQDCVNVVGLNLDENRWLCNYCETEFV